MKFRFRLRSLLIGLLVFQFAFLMVYLNLEPCGLKHFRQNPGFAALLAGGFAVPLLFGIFLLILIAESPAARDQFYFAAILSLIAGAIPAFALTSVCASGPYELLQMLGWSLLLFILALACLAAGVWPGLWKKRPDLAVMLAMLLLGIAVLIFLAPALEPRGAGHNAMNAQNSLRMIAGAQALYYAQVPGQRYGRLSDLSSVGQPSFLDPVLGSGTRSGYIFDLGVAPDGQSFTCRASPQLWPGAQPPVCERDYAGTTHYWIDDSGALRCNPFGAADQNSPEQYH